jgi:hypothetical protein
MAIRSVRYRAEAACYRSVAGCHHPEDGYRRRAVLGAAKIHRHFPARPVARESAGSAAYSAAGGAWAAMARGAAAAWAAVMAGAAATGVSDAAVEREDAAAAADDAAICCVGRTRAAQHSSVPNNPRR